MPNDEFNIGENKYLNKNKMKPVKKSDAERSSGVKKLFDFFNTNKDDILDKNELETLYNYVFPFANRDNNRILDSLEAKAFLNSIFPSGDRNSDMLSAMPGENQIIDGVSTNDVFELLGLSIEKEENQIMSSDEMVEGFKVHDSEEIKEILNSDRYQRQSGEPEVVMENGWVKAYIYRNRGVICFADKIEQNGELSGLVQYFNGKPVATFNNSNNGSTFKYLNSDKVEFMTRENGNNVTYVYEGSVESGKLLSKTTYFKDKRIKMENYSKGMLYDLDSHWSGDVYDISGKNKLYIVKTSWNGNIPVCREWTNLKTGEIKVVKWDTSPFEVGQNWSEFFDLADSSISKIIDDFEAVLSILKLYQSGQGFWDIEWDGLKVLSKPVGYLLNDVPQTISDMIRYYENKIAALKRLSPSSLTFKQDFRNIMGFDFDEEKMDKLQSIADEIDEQTAINYLEKSVYNMMEHLKDESVVKNDVYLKSILIPLYQMIYGDIQKAQNYVNTVLSLHRESAAKEFYKSLREYYHNITNLVNYEKVDTLKEQYRKAYVDYYGPQASSNADDFVEQSKLGSSIMEAVFTIASAGALTSAAGCGKAASYFVGRYGKFLGGIFAKVAPTVLISQTPIMVDSAYRLLAGNFNSEETFTRMWQGLMYGAFGAYISGPAGEWVKNVARTFQSNSGKIVNIMNGIFGAATETTLDVIFDRLTSDLSLEESLGQNGIMNFAMMFLGGDINRQYKKAEIKAARERAKNIKIQKNNDGTFTIKDETNGKTIHIKDNADLLCFLVTGKSMFDLGIHGRSSNDVSNGTNQHQVHNNQPAQSSEVTIHPENNKPENNTVSEEFKNKKSKLEKMLSKNSGLLPVDIEDILRYTTEWNIDFALQLCKDKKFDNMLMLLSVLPKTTEWNIDFALQLCKDKKLDNKLISDVLYYTTEWNIDFARQLCADSSFPEEKIGDVLCYTTEWNMDFVKWLYNDHNIPNDKIFDILRHITEENISGVKALLSLPEVKDFKSFEFDSFEEIFITTSEGVTVLYNVKDGKVKKINTEIRIQHETITRKTILEPETIMYKGEERQVSKVVEKTLKNKNGEFSGYEKTYYDENGNQIFSEVLKPVEGHPGEFKVLEYDRTSGFVKRELGTVKETTSPDGKTVTVERTMIAPSGTTYQKKVKTKNGTSSVYEIRNENGEVIFRQERSHEINGNTTRTVINGEEYRATFNSDGSITITYGNEVHIVPAEQFDQGLKNLYKQLPVDVLLTCSKFGIEINLGKINGNNKQASFYKLPTGEKIIDIGIPFKDDPFIFIHEFGHAVDDLMNLSSDTTLRSLFTQEYEKFRKTATLDEQIMIVYFTHWYGQFEEFVAETTALLSGSFNVDGLLGPRSIILQKYFPETMKYIADALAQPQKYHNKNAESSQQASASRHNVVSGKFNAEEAKYWYDSSESDFREYLEEVYGKELANKLHPIFDAIPQDNWKYIADNPELVIQHKTIYDRIGNNKIEFNDFIELSDFFGIKQGDNEDIYFKIVTKDKTILDVLGKNLSEAKKLFAEKKINFRSFINTLLQFTVTKMGKSQSLKNLSKIENIDDLLSSLSGSKNNVFFLNSKFSKFKEIFELFNFGVNNKKLITQLTKPKYDPNKSRFENKRLAIDEINEYVGKKGEYKNITVDDVDDILDLLETPKGKKLFDMGFQGIHGILRFFDRMVYTKVKKGEKLSASFNDEVNRVSNLLKSGNAEVSIYYGQDHSNTGTSYRGLQISYKDEKGKFSLTLCKDGTVTTVF